jgi:hypothetical protein
MLIDEIEDVPEPFLFDVLGLIHFLKSKHFREKKANAAMSQSSLEKDWLKPEEDEAWQSL